jgi:hypothetical protein
MKALKKKIHDLAMAVRKGDWSKYAELQAAKLERRKLLGLPIAAPAAEPAKEDPKPVEPEQPDQPPSEEPAKEEAASKKDRKKKDK